MTLQDYYLMLENFDWFYEMSDDGRVYERGRKAEARLKEVAKTSPKHKEMFDSFRLYIYSGPPWGTDKLPKPVAPD